MFDLEVGLTILLLFCLFAACAFEFVNGFHDTANAVATVIYTNSLKPNVAVIWSGICNFLGVLFGGIGVAMGIVNLLPVETLIDQNIYHSVGMIMALLLTAIIWNLGTWYFGLPCSSSHTLIGSILGVGIAYSFLPGSDGAAVNWSKATDIGMSLLISPVFGFSLTVFLMFCLKWFVKDKRLFTEPAKDAPPPLWIRIILLATCTSVSYFHGSNDGQKGVGLIMLILIGIVPTYFSLDRDKDPLMIRNNVIQVDQLTRRIDLTPFGADDKIALEKVGKSISSLNVTIGEPGKFNKLSSKEHFQLRKDILLISRNLEDVLDDPHLSLNKSEVSALKSNIKSMRSYTDYSPTWVILLVAVSLGLGTMVGWKRIVKTIGEKIGKEHLTYAQGGSAELVAASTIAVSTSLGLPVSTTHVLSSGIAGSMVASKGMSNLQGGTVRNIVLAWLLTLPFCIILSGGLFLLFRALF